jgi:aminopeptidase N
MTKLSTTNSMPFIRAFLGKLLLAIFLLATCAPAQAERRERLIDNWRPTHYEISLSLNDNLTEISNARAEISVLVLKDSVATLDLDFGEMPVDSVQVEGSPVRFVQSGGKLLVTLARPARANERMRVAVAYHGQPKEGLILATDKDGKPSATGDNWPDRVHHWIPCLDHPSAKATVRFTVTAPQQNLVVANGRLLSTTSSTNKTRTWIWDERVPISPYCMIIAVGDFARVEPRVQSITPLSYYVPQSERKYAMQGFAPAEPSLKYFSETVGPYPYEKLAMIVGATRFGGMENASAIVYSSNLFKDFETKEPRSRRYEIPASIRNVVAHEVAHQWFGDSVTEATWADLWLSEGFATYFECLFIERFEGRSAFREEMKANAEKVFSFEKEKKLPLHDRETEDLNELLNANCYEKGSWVLHMLRGLLGDRAFFAGLRDYYTQHRNATATTEDLRAALEKSSGLNLKDFFTRWVYQSGHPRYEVTWRWNRGFRANIAGYVELRIRQVQDDEPFLNPLTVEIVTRNGTRRTTVKPSGKDYVTRIQTALRPESLMIDPDDFVLKELTVKQEPR